MIIEKWKNANTYVIGKYHIDSNLACQDRTYYDEGNGIKVVVLADGAGSQKKSEIGAEITCKCICDLMINNFTQYLLMFENEKTSPNRHRDCMRKLSKEIISTATEKLKEKALELNMPVGGLASTLLFFAISDAFYIMGHIGDGVIAGLFSENNSLNVKILSEPENGSASNITFFVTDSDAADHLRLSAGKLENLIGVLLTSDGAGDVLFNANGVDKSVVELFVKFNRKTSGDYEKILSEYLSKVVSNYSRDDLSLNIIVLEDVEMESVTDDYKKYLLDDITSSVQIIRRSNYCYFLDPSIDSNNEFNTIEEVMEYLEWN